MRLHEYQSKQVFTRFGIPIPKGRVASTADDAKQIAEELGGRVIVKAQVLVGGRGKAGGVKLAKNVKEAEEYATQILRMEIKGLPVRKVLVDEAIHIGREIYLGITNDREARQPVLIASAEGGMDIEEVAHKNPERIYKVHIDPVLGLMDFQARDTAAAIDLPKDLWRGFIQITHNLWDAYNNCDATLAEINPLVVSTDNHLFALDGKMILDDNALYRHVDLADLRDRDAENPLEIEARKFCLSFIKLDGEIGCMVNGAGLAMATMDMITLFNSKPANFLDIGGGATAEKVTVAFRIILADKNVKSILINIFGGITRCDEVARGLLSAINETKPEIPLVVRLVGTNADQGLALLKQTRIITAVTLIEAAEKAVAAAQGSQI